MQAIVLIKRQNGHPLHEGPALLLQRAKDVQGVPRQEEEYVCVLASLRGAQE